MRFISEWKTSSAVQPMFFLGKEFDKSSYINAWINQDGI